MFKMEHISDPYLYNTEVENIFIGEYMSAAEGDYVKVYLLGLLYAKSDQGADHESIARQLSLDEEDVHKAWNYWESMGAVRKLYKDEEDRFSYDIEFLSLKEPLYLSEKRRGAAGRTAERGPENKELKAMFTKIEKTLGRSISGSEYAEIVSWVTELSLPPALCVFGVKYCKEVLKKDNLRYAGRILRGWAEKGIGSQEAAEEYLAEMDSRHRKYRQVMKELGFSRNATEAEKAIMDRWFDELGFDMEKIKAACAKTASISNPNIKYVNAVLEGIYREEKGLKEGAEGARRGDSAGPSQARRRPAYGKKGEGDPIARTQRYYELLHKRAREEALRRREKIEGEIPELRLLEEKLSASFSALVSASAFSGSEKENRIKRQKDEIARLEAEQRRLLKAAGYEEDYLETPYSCKKCKDTGFLDDGSRCSCFGERMKEAEEYYRNE